MAARSAPTTSATHRGQWATPVVAGYRDATVYANAPVSMGVLLLACLRALERAFPAGLPADGPGLTDLLVRLKHLVFAEVLPVLGDPGVSPNPDVLAEAAVDQLGAALAGDVPAMPAVALASDTTSIAVTAADGTSVCLIHSLFNEFGSRELVPGTGVVLNDRLANLTRNGGPNDLAPGKHPMHTLHCYVADLNDGTTLAGATPGGRGQVQTNLQVLIDVIDRGRPLPAAVSRPRWVNGMPRRSPDDRTVYLEPGLAAQAGALRASGHPVEVVDAQLDDQFGNCTVVARARTATPTSPPPTTAGPATRPSGERTPNDLSRDPLPVPDPPGPVPLADLLRRRVRPAPRHRPRVHGRAGPRLPADHRQQLDLGAGLGEHPLGVQLHGHDGAGLHVRVSPRRRADAGDPRAQRPPPDRLARSVIPDVRGALNTAGVVVDRIAELGLGNGRIGIVTPAPFIDISHDHHVALTDAFPEAVPPNLCV